MFLADCFFQAKSLIYLPENPRAASTETTNGIVW
jgi:hypothetical protein